MPLAECPALTNMLTDLSSRGRRSVRGFVSGKKKKKGWTDDGESEEAEYAREIHFRLELMDFARLAK